MPIHWKAALAAPLLLSFVEQPQPASQLWLCNLPNPRDPIISTEPKRPFSRKGDHA